MKYFNSGKRNSLIALFLLTILNCVFLLWHVSLTYQTNFPVLKNENVAKHDLVVVKVNRWSDTKLRCSTPRGYPALTRKDSDSFSSKVNSFSHEYATAAPKKIQEMRITRALVTFFPIQSFKRFELELRWLFRSWIEMQKSEPSKWRTDLVVFLERNETNASAAFKMFRDLQCGFDRIRKSSFDLPMCTLVSFTPISKRSISIEPNMMKLASQDNKQILYEYLLQKVDVFAMQPNVKSLFYNYIKTKLGSYSYVDSILMAFDGYDHFKKAGYNFLIRSDMDVFLTPLFAKWSPKNCNDFYVGRGAYSREFNIKRLRRVAEELELKYANIWNLGSTWYSTPEQFRLVSYLTLFGMGYISDEEFSPLEREGRLGSLNWPYWHYGVLLLYGQNLAMNHLIATRELNIIKLEELLDVSSTNNKSIIEIIHIHAYHVDTLFSKFSFKAGKYDHMINAARSANSTLNSIYSLKMALEGKFTTPKDLGFMFINQTASKN